MKTCLPCLPLSGHSLPVGIPQVPSPDHLPLWCGWGPSQSDPGAVADQCMGLPTPLLPPPRGRSFGRGLWLEQGETDDLNTLLVFVCMLCDQMSVFYLWKKSIALECIVVLSHSFDLTHISTCSCQSHWHWIAHNTLTNNAMSGLTCASLNSINPSSTFKPMSSFRPRGSVIGE